MMFYTQLFTSKRGPLAKIWLAAHWEKKLTKANVFECNLETTISDILSPKLKIGLRTSGHLLLGVVKIYSRKANYLLKDCSNALVKAKMAFRPGQTDLPEEGLEATIKAITLVEGFTTFDDQLPLSSNIDLADNFSLNQSRLEEITLKEDFETTLLSIKDFEEPQGFTNNPLDMSFHSFTQHGDQFGDEDRELDLLDFLTNTGDQCALTDFVSEEPQSVNMEHDAPNDQQDSIGFPEIESIQRVGMETPTCNQTTLLDNEEEAFALEPVAVTPMTERKRGKRRRKLVVDNVKELSNDFIAQQLDDYSDLVAPLELAPPTAQLMHWKENGGADKLFSQPCSFIVSPQIKEFLTHKVFQMNSHSVCEEVEEMRQARQEVQRNASSFTTTTGISEVSSVSQEKSHMSERTVLDYTDNHFQDSVQFDQGEPSSVDSLPAPPSEDSLFVHPSTMNQDTQSTSLHTQSLLNSEDFEERRASRQAQRLLATLKQKQRVGDSSFSLMALCRRKVRSQAAKTFFCFLLLKKRQTLELHQSAPYEDIVATPGPAFYE